MTKWLIKISLTFVFLCFSSSESCASCSHGSQEGIHPNHCVNGYVCFQASRNVYAFLKEAKIRGLVCNRRYHQSFVSKLKSPLRDTFISLSLLNRKLIQSKLSLRGYYQSSIDGLYGKGTAAALETYNKEYLGNADLTKSANVKDLFDDLLKEKPTSVSANKCQGSDTKSVKCRPITFIPRDEQVDAIEQVVATELAAPPTDFAKVKASYDAGNFSQAFKDAHTLSAEGNPNAQLYLGKMYADGRGTLQVTTSAHMWFNIASMNGSDEAYQERKKITALMTPSALEKAQQMAVSCIKSDYKECGLLVQPNKTQLDQELFTPSPSQLRNLFSSLSELKRKQIQYALKKLRYYKSSVDGLYGKGTARAFADYLADRENIKQLSDIYINLISEVDVPDSFAERQKTTVSKSNKEESKSQPKTSTQGYTREQATAICKPQAELAGKMAEIGTSSKRNSSIDCFGMGGSFSCSESSNGGGFWGGFAQAAKESRTKQRAFNAAYRLTLNACMAQHGWY